MNIDHLAFDLDEVDLSLVEQLGAKAANLGWIRRNGFPIPPGFVISAAAFELFARSNNLDAMIVDAERAARETSLRPGTAQNFSALRSSISAATIPVELDQPIRSRGRSLLKITGAVAVRSSAIDEDGRDASFAGQHLTVLGVTTEDGLLDAIARCWASLFDPAAIAYRVRSTSAAKPPTVAVIVQAQIDCDVAGTMFTSDPLTGADHVLIEGTWGLGESIAQGEVIPDCYCVNRTSLTDARPPQIGDKRRQRRLTSGEGTELGMVLPWRWRRAVIGAAQRRELVSLGLHLERLYGAPQDIEWGLAEGRWWIFQTRPITTGVSPATLSTDASVSRDWTSGFLDERLVEPVSPLGWSIVRQGLEDIAFREPLRLIGVDALALEPLTRLWNGHPYASVAVYEALYKLFPDWLLPEDARRFFPGGDVSRRKRAASPRSLRSFRVWLGLLNGFARDPLVMSPLHNAATWGRFEPRYAIALDALSARIALLEQAAHPELDRALALIEEVQTQNRQLLRIHRWSLTHAEVVYSLLRRCARAMLGEDGAAEYCAAAVRDLDDWSTRMNAEIAELRRADRESRFSEFQDRFRDFLAAYGHRSLSLDLIRPTFGEDPSLILTMIRSGQATGDSGSVDRRPTHPPRYDPRYRLLAPLARFANDYARLRENQRFAWQRGLALLRRLYLTVGRALAERGRIRHRDDVFFLTADEVERAASTASVEYSTVAHERRTRFDEDRARFNRDPRASYPPFLHGNEAWEPSMDSANARSPGKLVGWQATSDEEIRGEPVSPGIGRGRARVISRPDDLALIQPGEILVTRGADPGWSVVFDRLAGLVTERGGQLSHASVVAREYRLPAVVAVPRATSIIRTGDELVVDGSTGLVTRKREPSTALDVGRSETEGETVE